MPFSTIGARALIRAKHVTELQDAVTDLQGVTDELADELAGLPYGVAHPGNRIAILSDSTGRGVYNGDSEPGIGGATVYRAADSWSTWAQAILGGQMVRTLNASIIGDTLAMMDARVTADVIMATPKPTCCIIVSGYNDAFDEVAPASYMTTLDTIVGKLRQAEIAPIIGTPLPTANSADIAALLVQYSLGIRDYCLARAIPMLDFQTSAMDPTTGGLTSAIAAGGDGVHPGDAGQRLLGQYVADTLGPLLPQVATPLVRSPLDTANGAPNGLFAGTPTSGRAPNVFVYGSLPAGATPSVTTDALVPGSMQVVTHVATAGEATLAQRMPDTFYDPGDLLEFSGIVTATSIPVYVQIEFYEAPYAQMPINLTGDVTRGYFSARIPVPAAAAAGYIDLMLGSGPGTGTAAYGQLTVRNLTALGLA